MKEPSALIKTRLKRAAGLLTRCHTLTEIARRIGIDRSTFSRHRRDYPEFWEKVCHDATGAEYPPRPRGPTPRIRELLAKAAMLQAYGKTCEEIAEALNVSATHVRDWRCRYPNLWAVAYGKAAKDVVAVVRDMAGTEAVLQDVFHYERMATGAEKWLREEKGQELFPPGKSPTLSTFWRDYYLPQCADPAAGYVEHAESYLRRWRVFTGDPPLSKITNDLLVRYRETLNRARGITPGSGMRTRTVANHLRFIQRLLDRAGPPGPRNRGAAGILKKVPWIKTPTIHLYSPTTVPADMMSRIYEAAGRMTTPKLEGIEPADWWQALLAVAWNTGLRRGTLFALRLEDINWERCYLDIPPERLKAKRGEIIHLNAVALAHLEHIREPARERVFPWPHHPRYFDHRFHYVQDLAGIPRKDHVGLQAVRRTVGTNLAQQHPTAAQFLLGHTTFQTTKRFYIQSEGIVARALDTMEQPAAFKAG